MSIQIYNSLTKQKQEFQPIHPPTVKMYTCGVTVYDQCHIGHARSLYVFDMIRRYLQFRGFKVEFVRNITDVDDKIIHKAIETKRESKDVSEEQIRLYYEDMKALGVSKADKEPKATENIDEMIYYITGLIEKGYAYQSEGDVYYSVRKFEGYGKLSGQSIEKMFEAVRIEKGEKKKDPLDFALWKKSKEGEPSWDSPWGQGRPGWHIECSCMSLKHLNCQTLDIHAGGRDLIFPHHENEIAQSEAFTGKPFAKYWIHHGLLTINKQKMAKSSGNFITIKDAVEKYGANVLKMFFLSSHYRSPIDFSEEKIEEAGKNYMKLTRMVKAVDDFFANMSAEEKNGIKTEINSSLSSWRQSSDFFEAAMDDDFNTPKALSVLNNLITNSNTATMRYPQILHNRSVLVSLYYERYMALPQIAKIFNIEIFNKNVLTELQEELLNERKEARASKDFKRSDELRDDLLKKGIMVKDTKDGQKWEKV